MISVWVKKHYLQKQSPWVFYKKSFSSEFRNIHRKTPVLESLFNPIQDGGAKNAPYQFSPCKYYKRRN